MCSHTRVIACCASYQRQTADWAQATHARACCCANCRLERPRRQGARQQAPDKSISYMCQGTYQSDPDKSQVDTSALRAATCARALSPAKPQGCAARYCGRVANGPGIIEKYHEAAYRRQRVSVLVRCRAAAPSFHRSHLESVARSPVCDQPAGTCDRL